MNADRFRRLATRIRAIPGRFGLREHSVAILERSWDGEFSGDGNRIDGSFQILESGQNPKVRWFTDEELAVSGLSSGSVTIGPITSDHDAIRRLSTINGDDLSAGDARYVVIVGPKHPNGAQYRVTRINPERAIHYMINAAPVSRE